MPGEAAFLAFLRSRPVPAGLKIGVGDDLAALAFADTLLVGIDQVLDGVHFDSVEHAPEQIGRKAVNRNLSDCAAMACLPAGLVVSVALPAGAGLAYAKALYLGIESAAAAFDCPVLGGDTGSWAGRLAVTVAVLGRSAGVEPIRRSGARPGDGVFVSGALGGSILGRHLEFTPRVYEARELAGTGRVTAMLDLSDGLSTDAARLAVASGVGLELSAGRIPIHQDVSRMQGDKPPLDHALHDGEDHELLFTADVEPDAFPDSNPFAGLGYVTRIGTVSAEPGVRLDGLPVASAGFEHRL